MNTTLETPDLVRGAKLHTGPTRGQKLRSALSFRNIGAVYVLALIIVVFSIWIPSTFTTWETAKQILNGSAATGLMALALIIPLCTRTFDLSIGFVATLGAVISTYAIAHGVAVGAAGAPPGRAPPGGGGGGAPGGGGGGVGPVFSPLA